MMKISGKKKSSETTFLLPNFQIQALVFLSPRPVSFFEEEKWNFKYLLSQGFKIEVLEFTKLLNKKKKYADVMASVLEPLKGDFIHEIDSYEAFEEYVQTSCNQVIFIDYLIGHSDITLREERIFRILKKYEAKYILLSSGALPLPTAKNDNHQLNFKFILSKINKVLFSPSKFLNYLASKVIILLTRYRVVYPLPTMIFGGDSEKLQRFLNVRSIEKSKVVPINSFDYDKSIQLIRCQGGKLNEELDVCVFLDEAATHHSDFTLLGIKPAVAEVYFPAMNNFFNFVEKNTGFKVVIAAHPRSNYESMPDIFDGREIVKGKTAELVARSKLVIVHMSTSLSYAVIFEKAVLPVKIPGMPINGQLNLMVDVMAAAIGMKPIDLSKDKLTTNLFIGAINQEKYSEYKDRYLKTAGAEDLPEWEIVANSLKSVQMQGGLNS